MEIPMEAAMPCKMVKQRSDQKKLRASVSESDESKKIQKTKHACIVEAHESTRKRLEPTLPKDHDDHRAERGYNSIGHCNLVHKFGPIPQALKIPDAKAVVDEAWKKLKKTSLAWQLDEVGSQKEIILEAQSDQKKVHFATLMDICHLKNAQ